MGHSSVSSLIALFLLFSVLIFGKLDKRPGRFWLLPAILGSILLSGWASGNSVIFVCFYGLLVLYGLAELLWMTLGRIRKGGAALLFSLLLIPVLGGTWALQSQRCVPVGDEALGFMKALFTAVSAVTVTGLSLIDVGSALSQEGKWILLGLIQLGGLGTVTLFVVFMSVLGQGLGLRQGRALSEAMDGMDASSMKALLVPILVTTLFIEAVGAFVLNLAAGFSISWPSFDHLFHSVSAFCNAGFSLHADSISSFGSFQRSVMAFLIILGGLGFPVIWAIWKRMKARTNRLGVHVYLSVGTSCLLWLIGGALLFIGGVSIGESAFWSVTCRTAGFSITPVESLLDQSILIFIVLMLIGASPGSTGGGLKTSTFGILLIALYHQIFGRDQVQFMGRTLPDRLVRSASVLVIVYALIWFFLLLLLHWTESAQLKAGLITQQQILFEATSALGTVGLSMGITESLTTSSKAVLMIAMILGRLGPLALIVGLASLSQKKDRVERPEGKVMLG